MGIRLGILFLYLRTLILMDDSLKFNELKSLTTVVQYTMYT